MEKDQSITSRPFRVLADCGKVYQFLIDIYEKDWRNGVPAPFLSTLIRRSLRNCLVSIQLPRNAI